MLKRGLKKFRTEGKKATYKEMEQLHKRTCFTPISIKELTKEEKKKAQRALCFLTQKNDGQIKARTVYNRNPTREWLSQEDSLSLTALTEGVMLTSVVDTKEERDVLCLLYTSPSPRDRG